jgi:hypothetical protein
MPISTLLMGSLAGGAGGAGAGGGMGQGIANIAGGLIGGVSGLFQKKKAKKLLREAGEQPIYNIPQEILANQKMAEQAATEGLPSQQYNNAMKNIQRSQANALSGALDRKSALMALPKIQQQSNDAYGNLDVTDANARMQYQKTLYGIGAQTAQYRDKAYQLNQLQPWQRKHTYAQQLLGAGNQNFIGGLEKFVGGLGQVFLPGAGGGGGGSSDKKSTSSTIATPKYYNGYGADSDYSDFQTQY